MTKHQKPAHKHYVKPAWLLPIGILLLALVLRLVWVLDAGYAPDVAFFVPWIRIAAQGGIQRVFAVAKTSYPPLSVYLLWLLGLFSQTGTFDGPPTLVELLVLRVAIIFFDLLTVAVLYRLGRRVAGHTIGAWAALLYALCPGGVYLSGWWIQTDAWFILPMLLGVWWLSHEQIGLSWAALGVAMTFKLQAMLVFPIFVVCTWRWYGPKYLLIGIIVLVLIVSIVIAPLLFHGQVTILLSKTTATQATHLLQWITMTSHNLWYLVTPYARAVGHAANRDQNAFIAGISFRDAGLVLLSLTYSLVLGRLFIRSGPRAVFAACAVVWFAFFTLATRVHARYIFPSLALMLCAGFYQRRWWATYGMAATTLLVNLVLKSLDASPLANVLPITPDRAVVNAWANVTILGLTLIFYLLPLTHSTYFQTNLEGKLRESRYRWELVLLSGSIIVLLGTLGTALWRGRVVGQQIAALESPLRASLEASLLDRVSSPEDIVVVNWPGAILADRSAHLFGIIPVTPPALFLTAPDIVEYNATWVQYPPWQQVLGLEIEYYGTHVTQAELITLAQHAERVAVFNPPTRQMFTLMQSNPKDSSSTCMFSFDERVCLTTARAAWEESLIRIELTWEVSGTLSSNDTVFVHILDAQGNLVAQADGDLARGLIPLNSLSDQDKALCETRIVAVPPGNYDIHIGIYNRISGQRLRAGCKSSPMCLEDAVMIIPVGSNSNGGGPL